MKKILMVSHSSGGGGAETVFLKAVDSLKEENNLTIAVNSNEGYLIQKIETNNIKLINVNNFWLHSSVIKFLLRLIFWNSISILKLMKYVKQEKIDYIYSGTIVNYIGVVVAILTGKPHVWHIHEMDNPGHEWFNPKLNFIVRYFFKKSKMIFISEGVKNSWLKRLKLKENEVDCQIIYNPIKEFSNTQKRFENIEQKIVIGCAGSFGDNKNQKLLIETYIELRKKYSNIHLKLAGSGVIEGSKSIIQGRLSKEDYTLYDYMDIQDFFDEIDILVVPSFSESWSLVAIEAASYGLIPVITTETSINEVLKDEQNCYFIDPFSKNDLYEKLEYIILNYKEVQSRIIKNNRELLKNKDFNVEFKRKICAL